MRNKVKQFIREKNLLTYDSKIIVGLSGGADSVVLLHILHHLGYPCIAAHCNFHLRNEESMRDEHFVASLTKSWGIPYYSIDFDTHAIASERKISIEMAARDLRYEWFEQLRKKLDASAIAIAHHQDDSVETMLLNLIRGTGIKGLTGIKPQNGSIIRPLLCLSKTEVLNYANEHQLEYVIDSTNNETDFIRNKIRLQIIPLLETINPSLTSGLIETIENLTEAEKIYNNNIATACSFCFNETKQEINISRLLSCASPEAVLYEVFKKYGFRRSVILDIAKSLDSQSGKEFFSDKYRIVKDRETLVLTPIVEIQENKIYQIDKTTKKLQEPVNLEILNIQNSPDIQLHKENNYAYFDEDKLTFPLILRKWQNGDRFVPYGMKGSQKLSDYFSNHKFSLVDKENTWILCSGNDICWIVGHRTDNRFKVEKNTKKVYQLKLY